VVPAKPPRALFHLDKWCVDTLLPDGTVLLVYLGRLLLAGKALVRVTAELFNTDGSRIAGSAEGGAFKPADGRLLCGQADIEGERLRFRTPGLSGELRFVARRPAFAPGPLLTRGARALSWTVEVPDADVTGELHWPGGGRALHGRGYRDRVTFDILPWRLPLRTLRWGRAVAGEHSVSFLHADVGAHAPPLVAGVCDGEALSGMPQALVLGASRELLAGPIIDLQGLHLGALRPLLRLATRNPDQHKWAAAATLHGEAGRAIHELVRFGDAVHDAMPGAAIGELLETASHESRIRGR